LVTVVFWGIGATTANAQNRDRGPVVMTINMDTGSDFGFVVSAKTPLDLVLSVTATYQEIQASNIPERAGGIAREIQATRPYLVGLQEVPRCAPGRLAGRPLLWWRMG
jgi:hypothetical protein